MDLAVAGMNSLGPGTVLDGEAVVYSEGMVGFAAAQSRAASDAVRACELAAGSFPSGTGHRTGRRQSAAVPHLLLGDGAGTQPGERQNEPCSPALRPLFFSAADGVGLDAERIAATAPLGIVVARQPWH
ncbi:hypothetical protein ACFC4G_39160 [Streptomyces sp. NPDC056002]|uniref:hypothetical protein n=1 Tax=Streptomyces sp. NPDC056002 TaxID=3345675 RepID=UPI0035D64819